MQTERFDYELPEELIAQEPAEPRDAARLLVCRIGGGAIEHHHVRDLPAFLGAGDLLVRNRTRVIPARLLGRKATGGRIELLLVHPTDEPATGPGERWICMIRGRVRPGSELLIDGGDTTLRDPVAIGVVDCHDDGTRTVAFPPGCSVLVLAERLGRVPLPPYIRREATERDRDRYQTVFATNPGSVAAPTASLHLTDALLERLERAGCRFADIDLAVGPGTFKPVQSEDLTRHAIHAERCACPPDAVAAIAQTRAAGGRVVALGTTVTRTLETAARQPGGLAPYAGWSRLFLHPPQRLQVVDALLTNFHLPRSTLLMLVACHTGIDLLHRIYREAVRERYRFYSYGDAMLLLP